MRPLWQCAALAWLSAAPALGSGWQGLYTPSERERPALSALPEEAVCVREILDAQLRYNIPDNILLGIGLQESGVSVGDFFTVWPWSVNATGEGRMFSDRAAAMAWTRERQAAGTRSIDVGCMQVNLLWHPNAFAALEEGFDPVRNVDYAARFLRDLYFKTGDWELAAGSYHSFTPAVREVYLASLRRNVKAANARIAEFRDIAAAAMAAAAAPAPTGAPSGLLWTSGISQLMDGDGGIRSLYSKQALQPLLPQMQRVD